MEVPPAQRATEAVGGRDEGALLTQRAGDASTAPAQRSATRGGGREEGRSLEEAQVEGPVELEREQRWIEEGEVKVEGGRVLKQEEEERGARGTAQKSTRWVGG